MNDKRQAGFGVTIVIVAALVIAGLGYLGYRLYSSYDKPIAKTTTSSDQGSRTHTNTTTPQQTDPNAGYFVIKEWGVRFRLTNNLNGLEYLIRDHTVTFTTEELKRLSPKCDINLDSTSQGLGNFYRIPTDMSGSEPKELLITTINGYNYYHIIIQPLCVNSPLLNKVAFYNSLNSLEASK